jgi:hypothetical protein
MKTGPYPFTHFTFMRLARSAQEQPGTRESRLAWAAPEQKPAGGETLRPH